MSALLPAILVLALAITPGLHLQLCACADPIGDVSGCGTHECCGGSFCDCGDRAPGSSDSDCGAICACSTTQPGISVDPDSHVETPMQSRESAIVVSQCRRAPCSRSVLRGPVVPPVLSAPLLI